MINLELNKIQHTNRRMISNRNYSGKIPFGRNSENKKHPGRTILLTGAAAGAFFFADLFLAKGKVLSTLSKNKINFIKTMSDEIDNVVRSDSYATKSRLEAFFSVPGLHAVWNHRVIHKLHEWKVPVLPRLFQNISRFFTGIEIHPGAKLGKNIFIDHTGAIIGETAEIGNNVTIIGRAVLGSTGKGNNFLRHTVVEDGVTIGMNSTMLGRIKLGKNSKIGAGALITHDVPANSTVIGNPAKIISINNKKIENPMLLNTNSNKEIEQYLRSKGEIINENISWNERRC